MENTLPDYDDNESEDEENPNSFFTSHPVPSKETDLRHNAFGIRTPDLWTRYAGS